MDPSKLFLEPSDLLEDLSGVFCVVGGLACTEEVVLVVIGSLVV